jgi:hypothetical protein
MRRFAQEGHKPEARKGFSWPVCRKCGLIYLNNPFSQWAVRMGCNNDQHPQYEHMRTTLGGKA